MTIEVVGISRTAKSRELTDYWRITKEPPTPEELSDAPIAPRRQAAASVPPVPRQIAATPMPEPQVKRKRGRPPLPPELRKTKPKKKKAEIAAAPALVDAEVASLPIQGLLEALAAVRAPSPEKTAVNMRLDADVVAWLRRNGGSLSDRINSALRALMNLDLAVA
jgi:uncharacterized protein (DUF4415 family)